MLIFSLSKLFDGLIYTNNNPHLRKIKVLYNHSTAHVSVRHNFYLAQLSSNIARMQHLFSPNLTSI